MARLNSNFKIPFVFINMAMTVDGKIATANRAVSSFGSRRDVEHLYELRATADAVMCGARTVELSESIMGNGGDKFGKRRLENGLKKYNLRVIVSGSGSIDPNAKIFQRRFSPIIILTTGRIPKDRLQKLRATADEVKICGETEINFRMGLRWLRTKWKVGRLLCEGGGELNDTLFRADLVDEINLTICPKIFGGRTGPTIADGKGFSKLELTRRFQLQSRHQLKGELFTVFSRSRTRRA